MSDILKNQATLLPQEKRVLLSKLLKEKTLSTTANAEKIPPEYYNFELYPNSRILEQQLSQLMSINGHVNPYFTVHQGINNNLTLVNGQELINYSSYNYLGMSGDPKISCAAKDAIDRYGTSVSASRIVSGEIPLHLDLEKEIAELVGVDTCIVYVSGHATNETTIGHLFEKDDLILYDSLIHNSAIQGCHMSEAISIPYPHNNWQALDKILEEQRSRYKRILIVTEGVYSMDGDIPNLPKFIEVKKRHKAFLMVDEAHSIGVLGKHGRGIGEYFGIISTDVDLWMGTLSKSFASCGGYIAGCERIIKYLKYTAPGFVYSVGMSPPNAAAALAAIKLLKTEPERVTRLHERAKLFLQLASTYELDTGTSKNSPVIPIIISDSSHCVYLCKKLLARGINVQPMIYPAVPEKASRLRFFISCTHTEEQIRFTVNTLAEELRAKAYLKN